MKKITKALAITALLVPALTMTVANAGKKPYTKKEMKCMALASAKTGISGEKDPKKKAAGMKTKKWLKSYDGCIKGRGTGTSALPIPKF